MKTRPASYLRTFARIWPALLIIPFRLIYSHKNFMYFRHPLSTTNGKVHFADYCEVGANVYLNGGDNGIEIGAFSQINALTSIVGDVQIGQRVLIAPSCSIVSGGHKFGRGVSPRFSGSVVNRNKISIEDDVWVGAGVVVVGNVTIGKGSVLAAGVVVDADVPEGTLVRRGPKSLIFEKIR